MYYRLQYSDGKGILAYPGAVWYELRAELGKELAVPKYLKENRKAEGFCNTRSWFTEKGYQKYQCIIEKILDYFNIYHWNVELVQASDIFNIVSKGKIQVLEKLET